MDYNAYNDAMWSNSMYNPFQTKPNKNRIVLFVIWTWMIKRQQKKMKIKIKMAILKINTFICIEFIQIFVSLGLSNIWHIFHSVIKHTEYFDTHSVETLKSNEKLHGFW